MKFVSLLFIVFLFYSVRGQHQDTLLRNTMTVGCLLIKKPFMKKNGEPSNNKEYYLRCSVQDYFIKMCESNVTSEELDKYIDKGVNMRIELINGYWDICNGDPTEIQRQF